MEELNMPPRNAKENKEWYEKEKERTELERRDIIGALQGDTSSTRQGLVKLLKQRIKMILVFKSNE